MIGYCSIDDLESPPPKKIETQPPPPPQHKKLFDGETTECNYLVMAFVLGVLFLALTDSVRR